MLFSKEIIFIRPVPFPLNPFVILQNIFFAGYRVVDLYCEISGKHQEV